MKEIKFRGMSVDTGKWLYGVPLFSGRDAFIITVDDRGCDLDSSVIKDSVGQYAGLKDRNGKEIYEGDALKNIVSYGHNTWITIVVFEDGMFTVKNMESGHVAKVSPCIDIRNAEIIGNIYDNPELLG